MFLQNLKASDVTGTIPPRVLMMYQMTFAMITPALIMVWDGGLLAQSGVLDFAGGSVGCMISGKAGWIDGNTGQVMLQVSGALVVIGYSAVATAIILWLTRATVGLGVYTKQKDTSLDLCIPWKKTKRVNLCLPFQDAPFPWVLGVLVLGFKG
jgi:ammonia channel protein AmtB